MSYRLGVDLGSTWTTAAVSRDGVTSLLRFPSAAGAGSAPAMPSVVLADAAGALLIGEEAVLGAADAPGRSVNDILLRLGDPTPIRLGGAGHSPGELLAALLEGVVARARAQQGEDPTEVVLSCPAVWGPYRSERFAEVPGLARVEHAQIVPGAQLAATRYGRAADLPDFFRRGRKVMTSG